MNKRQKVKECLSGPKLDLGHKTQELKDLRRSNGKWKFLWNRTLKIHKYMRERFETRGTYEAQLREEIEQTSRNPQANIIEAWQEVERISFSNKCLREEKETMKKKWKLKLKEIKGLAQRDRESIYYAHVEAGKWYGKCVEVVEIANHFL